MSPAARPRNAAATRGALLTAARELFAVDGFERTTVRAVAERAGVNQALLFRYFGNKERLFAEAVTDLALRPLQEGPPETLLERLVTATLADEPTSAMFFAALSTGASAADAVRLQIAAAYREVFAALATSAHPDLPPDDALLRADLMLAWLQGIGEFRPQGDPRTVAGHVVRTARVLLTG